MTFRTENSHTSILLSEERSRQFWFFCAYYFVSWVREFTSSCIYSPVGRYTYSQTDRQTYGKTCNAVATRIDFYRPRFCPSFSDEQKSDTSDDTDTTRSIFSFEVLMGVF